MDIEKIAKAIEADPGRYVVYHSRLDPRRGIEAVRPRHERRVAGSMGLV